jgi:hypothetical protein
LAENVLIKFFCRKLMLVEKCFVCVYMCICECVCVYLCVYV